MKTSAAILSSQKVSSFFYSQAPLNHNPDYVTNNDNDKPNEEILGFDTDISITHASKGTRFLSIKDPLPEKLKFSKNSPSVSFDPIQEWEGYVKEINGDKFTADLIDLTDPNNKRLELGEFDINDISNDPSLLKEGAVFRISIGYKIERSGSRTKNFQIIFRRLPAWSKTEIENSKKEAAELINSIQWD